MVGPRRQCKTRTFTQTKQHPANNKTITPVIVKGQKHVALRLEKYFEDWEGYAGLIEEKTVCVDISRLSRKELDKVLKKVKIDLPKTQAEDEEVDD